MNNIYRGGYFRDPSLYELNLQLHNQVSNPYTFNIKQNYNCSADIIDSLNKLNYIGNGYNFSGSTYLSYEWGFDKSSSFYPGLRVTSNTYGFSNLLDGKFNIDTLVLNPETEIGSSVPSYASGVICLNNYDIKKNNPPKSFRCDVYSSDKTIINRSVSWYFLINNIYYSSSSITCNGTGDRETERIYGLQYWKFYDFTY